MGMLSNAKLEQWCTAILNKLWAEERKNFEKSWDQINENGQAEILYNRELRLKGKDNRTNRKRKIAFYVHSSNDRERQTNKTFAYFLSKNKRSLVHWGTCKKWRSFVKVSGNTTS